MKIQRAVTTVIISTVLLGLCWVVLRWRADLAAASVEQKRAALTFQTQLDEKDQLIQDLRAQVQQSHRDSLEVAAAFKNRAETLERQSARPEQTGATAPDTAEMHLVALRVMREQLNILQGEVKEARRQARELSASLMVPVELSNLEPVSALDMAALKDYWPFFEAKREREKLEKSAEDLTRHIIAVEVELALPKRQVSKTSKP
jgi:hypothetical protein